MVGSRHYCYAGIETSLAFYTTSKILMESVVYFYELMYAWLLCWELEGLGRRIWQWKLVGVCTSTLEVVSVLLR